MDSANQAIPRRPDVSLAILILGGLAYAFLCGPAINRRGYPPIDPIWMGMTHLWIGPLVLSAIFDARPFAGRRLHVILYALSTAFVHAATFGMSVPRHVDLIFVVFSTLFLYGPFHLVIAWLVEWFSQLVLARFRRLSRPAERPPLLPRLSLSVWLLGYSIVCITVGFPFAYREVVLRNHRERGREDAEVDWRQGKAVIYSRGLEAVTFVDGVEVVIHIDPSTGLYFEHVPANLGWSDAYTARIRELVAEQGEPQGSLKNVKDALHPSVLAALLGSGDFVEITELPYDASPNITLLRAGSVTRGRSTFGTGGPGLSIVSANGLMSFGSANNRVFIGEIVGQPDLIVVRDGNSRLGVFHRDGRLLASARK